MEVERHFESQYGTPALATEAATPDYDVAVVGAGAAGLYVSFASAERGARVCLVSRKPLAESASFWAQGGLAAALAADDSPERHAEDTLNAGRGSCRRAAVDVLAREAPGAVGELLRLGVRFDTEADGSLALGLEGGHSARRIVHAGGSETGRALTGRLAELVSSHPGVTVMEGTSVEALWSDGRRCAGALTDRGAIAAPATILATGGAAALWRRTTNPWGAIGAGAVIAHAAGADVADVELCQFHPTALALAGHPRDGALLTEAIRGEGATLLDASGRRFTDELAPRDQVTAAILDRMAADESECVWLDMRSVEPGRFPNVIATMRDVGIDPATDLVPVSPAAHYLIGGVATDLDGRASLPGLYAVGECACTGLHGANRLASNSLSECFVFAARAAEAAVAEPRIDGPPPLPEWRFEPPTEATRDAMWALAGPRRSGADLERLLDQPYPLARLVAASALARKESRGAHRRVDFPTADPAFDGVHFVCSPSGDLSAQRWP
jgi:L-aspartate oxidase